MLADDEIMLLVDKLESYEIEQAFQQFNLCLNELTRDLNQILARFERAYIEAGKQEASFRREESAQRRQDIKLVLSVTKVIIGVASSSAGHLFSFIQEEVMTSINASMIGVIKKANFAGITFSALYEKHSEAMYEKLEEKFDAILEDALSINLSDTKTENIVEELGKKVNRLLCELQDQFIKQYKGRQDHHQKMLELIFKFQKDYKDKNGNDPSAATVELHMRSLLRNQVQLQYQSLKDRVMHLRLMSEAFNLPEAKEKLEIYFQRRMTSDFVESHHGKRFSRTLGHRLNLLFPHLVAQRLRTPGPLIFKKTTGRDKAEHKEIKAKAKYQLSAGLGIGDGSKRQAILDDLQGEMKIELWNDLVDDLRLLALKRLPLDVRVQEIANFDDAHRVLRAKAIQQLPARYKSKAIDALCVDEGVSDMSCLDMELKIALTTPAGHKYDEGSREIPWSGNPNPNAKENKTRRTKILSHTDSRGRPATAGLFKGRVRRNRVHPIACRKINVEPADSINLVPTWAKPRGATTDPVSSDKAKQKTKQQASREVSAKAKRKTKSHFFKSAVLLKQPSLDKDDENNTPESTR